MTRARALRKVELIYAPLSVPANLAGTLFHLLQKHDEYDVELLHRVKLLDVTRSMG